MCCDGSKGVYNHSNSAKEEAKEGLVPMPMLMAFSNGKLVLSVCMLWVPKSLHCFQDFISEYLLFKHIILHGTTYCRIMSIAKEKKFMNKTIKPPTVIWPTKAPLPDLQECFAVSLRSCGTASGRN